MSRMAPECLLPRHAIARGVCQKLSVDYSTHFDDGAIQWQKAVLALRAIVVDEARETGKREVGERFS